VNCIHLISAEYCEKKKKKKKKNCWHKMCSLYSAYLKLDFGIINAYISNVSRGVKSCYVANLRSQTIVTAWKSQNQTNMEQVNGDLCVEWLSHLVV
jgi:hypothetical protein